MALVCRNKLDEVFLLLRTRPYDGASEHHKGLPCTDWLNLETGQERKDLHEVDGLLRRGWTVVAGEP